MLFFYAQILAFILITVSRFIYYADVGIQRSMWSINEYQYRMLVSSYLFIFNAIHSYHCELYDCCFIIVICWINSINYWRLPVDGPRRKIDLVSSGTALIYFFCLSFSIREGDYYRTGCVFFVMWYMLALLCGRCFKYPSCSSICHVNMHTTAIVFNTWFFPKLRELNQMQEIKKLFDG